MSLMHNCTVILDFTTKQWVTCSLIVIHTIFITKCRTIFFLTYIFNGNLLCSFPEHIFLRTLGTLKLCLFILYRALMQTLTLFVWEKVCLRNLPLIWSQCSYDWQLLSNRSINSRQMGCSQQDMCVWDYHIKNIHSYWHHTKPKADKTFHM